METSAPRLLTCVACLLPLVACGRLLTLLLLPASPGNDAGGLAWVRGWRGGRGMQNAGWRGHIAGLAWV